MESDKKVSNLNKQLQTAQKEVDELHKRISDDKNMQENKINAANMCSTDLSALNEKIGAFAKQAAICNVLREKLQRS